MKHRPEIDGLRAIAIIPVILFHANLKQFSGGFVGVDVFFVISGYLITTLILSEKEQGIFLLSNFYERRARRILPALFLVAFVSLPFAWFWLFSFEKIDFYLSLIAVFTFTSNILFWQESGYWGLDNELKPLLNTWSLAVEEQYYLLFPILLMITWKFSRYWIIISLLLIAVTSLLISQWGAYNKPAATFFLFPTRAFEFAIGAIIAFYLLYKKQIVHTRLHHKYNLVEEGLSILGLILIGYSVLSFNETTPFPGFFALVPTIGAGLIILFSSEKNTIVGKILSLKISVIIGLISYSAYLWHHPLFAFARHRSLTVPDEFLFVILSIVTFILAYLSWIYVEKPFRKQGKISSSAFIIFGVSCSSFFIAIGLAGYITNGFDFLSPKNQLGKDIIKEKLKVNNGLSKTCEGSFTLSAECRTSDEPEILIWGDSYAMHLVNGIIASRPDAKVVQMTKSSCGPFFDLAPKFSVSWAEDCLKFTDEVRKWLNINTTVKYVVVSSHFSQYLSGDNELLSRSGKIEKKDINSLAIDFIKTLDELESMDVIPVVFSPPPANGIDLGRCLAKAEQYRLNLDECNFNISTMLKSRKNAYHFLEKIKKKHRIIRLDKFICDEYICKTHINDSWLFRDAGHLSHEGSEVLGKAHDFYTKIVKENHIL